MDSGAGHGSQREAGRPEPAEVVGAARPRRRPGQTAPGWAAVLVHKCLLEAAEADYWRLAKERSASPRAVAAGASWLPPWWDWPV
jgi:hypothetical protein